MSDSSARSSQRTDKNRDDFEEEQNFSFVRTTNEKHKKIVQDVWKRLEENKSLEELYKEGTTSHVMLLDGIYRTSSFHMTCCLNTIMSKHLALIRLDKEDVEYFKKKYLTKEILKKEMETEIEAIKSKYQ